MECDGNCFQKKRVLVTGGSRGIGLDVARALHKRGAHVIIIGRDEARLKAATEEMPGLEVLAVDLMCWSATAESVKNVLPLDYLVNNAGICIPKQFGEFTEQEVANMFSVNYFSAFNVSQIVVNDWIQRKQAGAIVNMSSDGGIRPFETYSVYCGTKFALDSLTRCMALELGPKNIRVNSVNPTLVLTELGQRLYSDPEERANVMADVPLRRFPETRDVVNATLFLLSDAANCITGAILPVDGGNSL